MSETEENRVERMESVLTKAARQKEYRVSRAKMAVHDLGMGSVYGTDILLSLEEAEELAHHIKYGGLVDV